MTKSSTYLYSDQNRELYKKILDEHNQLSCVFSRNLISRLERTVSFSNALNDDHLKECSLCSRIFISWKEKMAHVENEIPFCLPEENEKQLMNSECRQLLELIKDRENSQKALVKKAIFERLKKFPYMIVKEFSGIILSKEFAKGTLLAAVSACLVFLAL